MADLKLLALDAEDLSVLSAHLQDAVVSVGDMAYLKSERRFALLANRFDWEKAVASPASAATFERRRTGLRFERVEAAQLSAIDLKNAKLALSLLDLVFEETDPPAGFVTLRFSGGAAIRLRVECIEAELKDLGAAWTTKSMPKHAGGEPSDGSQV